jgi:hypothetical protein
LAEAILAEKIVELPAAQILYKPTNRGFDWISEPRIPLIKALGRGLHNKGLVGQIVNVKVKRDGLPDIIVPLRVPTDDPKWWITWERAKGVDCIIL